MKIRQGFVSNSSSSSFIVAGVSMDLESFKEFFNYTDDEWEEALEACNIPDTIKAYNVEFDVVIDYENEEAVVGKQFHNGSGFYGTHEFKISDFIDSMNSVQVDKLLEKGYQSSIVIGQFGEG